MNNHFLYFVFVRCGFLGFCARIFLLMFFCLGGVGTAYAVSSKHVNKRLRVERIITVRLGEQEVRQEGQDASGRYVYRPGMTMQVDGDAEGSWFFFYTPNPDQTPDSPGFPGWLPQAFRHGPVASPDDIDAIRGGLPGYYYFRYSNVETPLAFVVGGIMDVNWDQPIRLAGNPYAPMRVAVTVAGDALQEVSFEVSGPTLARRGGMGGDYEGLQAGQEIRVGTQIEMYWPNAGRYTIRVKYGGMVRQEIPVEVYALEWGTRWLACNWNDSNKNGVRDDRDEPFTNPQTGLPMSDPDIRKLEIALVLPTGERYALGGDNPVSDEILMQCCLAGNYRIVRINRCLKLYSSPSKEQMIAGPLRPQVSSQMVDLQAEKTFFNNLYIEGVEYSPAAGASFELGLASLPDQFFVFSGARIMYDVFLLRLNIASSEAMFTPAQLTEEAPLDLLPNPVVIPLNVEASFGIDRTLQPFVPEDTPAIWWQVLPFENPWIPYAEGRGAPAQAGGAVCNPQNGTRTRIAGTIEGFVRVEVGVYESNGQRGPAYTGMICYVGRRVTLPYIMKYFNFPAGGSSNAFIRYMTTVRKKANIILRQANIELVPVPGDFEELDFRGDLRAGMVDFLGPVMGQNGPLFSAGELILDRQFYRSFFSESGIPLNISFCRNDIRRPVLMECRDPDIIRFETSLFQNIVEAGAIGNWFVEPYLRPLERIGGGIVPGESSVFYNIDKWELQGNNHYYTWFQTVTPHCINFHIFPSMRGHSGYDLDASSHPFISKSVLSGNFAPEDTLNAQFLLSHGFETVQVGGQELPFENEHFLDTLIIATGMKDIFHERRDMNAPRKLVKQLLINAGMRSTPYRRYNSVPSVDAREAVLYNNVVDVPRNEVFHMDPSGLGIDLAQAILLRNIRLRD